MSTEEEMKRGFEMVNQKVEAALKKHTDEVLENGRASKKTSQELKSLTEQHEDLRKEMVKLGDSVVELAQKSDNSGQPVKTLSMGQQFVEGNAFAEYKLGRSAIASQDFEMNIITEGLDNTITRHEQLPGVVPGAFRALSVMPTVSLGTTGSNLIHYSRELAWVNNAAETAEGGLKPQSDLTFEAITERVKTIPHIIHVSKQALDDSQFLQSFIDRRMRHGVSQRIERQIIAGDGVGENLTGWLPNATSVSGAGTVDLFGLANKMKYQVINSDYVADYFYVNPQDWGVVERGRRSATDKAFVGNTAAVAYVNNGLTPLLWGLPVITSNNVPVGTIICKSQDADMYFDRQNVTVEMFEQNKDNVEKNLVTVRAEARGALAIMTPAAILSADITSIT